MNMSSNKTNLMFKNVKHPMGNLKRELYYELKNAKLQPTSQPLTQPPTPLRWIEMLQFRKLVCRKARPQIFGMTFTSGI